MSTAKSLHIGLNYIDPVAYGDNGELFNCVNDANSMESLAKAVGFTTTKLIDNQATSSKIITEINSAANSLRNGDIYLITYSGHGAQIPDNLGEESDNFNETWCLYDRQLIDNELFSLWSRFSSGVRIFVTSDSCHSGTILRMVMKELKSQENSRDILNKNGDKTIEGKIYRKFEIEKSRSSKTKIQEPKYRLLSYSNAMEDYRKREHFYKSIQVLASPKNRTQVQCSVILISGCQDNQLSSDGSGSNGLFTQRLLEIWNNGTYNSNYNLFHQDILSGMPGNQSPNFMVLGLNTLPFENQKPYTIASPWSLQTGGNSNNGSPIVGGGDLNIPSVNGPATWPNGTTPPEFFINRGGNPYFYFEITSDFRLFNYEIKKVEGNTRNFWASWEDNINNRLSGDTFTLPQNVWNNLKNNSRLYFKIGTTSSTTGWDNHKVSLEAGEFAIAPSMQITFSQIDGNFNNGSSGGNTGSNGSSIELELSASVGVNGVNMEDDVKLVQSLLNQLEDTEGGANPDLVIDGKYGSNTQRAIRHFQQKNDLETSGKLQPNGNGFLILKMKARKLILCVH